MEIAYVAVEPKFKLKAVDYKDCFRPLDLQLRSQWGSSLGVSTPVLLVFPGVPGPRADAPQGTRPWAAGVERGNAV